GVRVAERRLGVSGRDQRGGRRGVARHARGDSVSRGAARQERDCAGAERKTKRGAERNAKVKTRALGPLRAVVAGGSDGGGGGDGPGAVLCPGLGAPGDALVGLVPLLRAPAPVRFVFPEAPLALDAFGGRAWWMIDLDQLALGARRTFDTTAVP